MTATETWTREEAVAPARDWGQALRRGLVSRCPACGEGRLFRAYLKPVERCAACGEDLSHQRSDDAPPYITISVVGHVVLAALMIVEQSFENVPLWVHFSIWPALALGLSLWWLPAFKGATIGHQWALRMHGFGAGKEST